MPSDNEDARRATDAPVEFTERLDINELCTRLGMTEQALATAIGRSVRSLARWEREGRIPVTKVRRRIGKLLESQAACVPVASPSGLEHSNWLILEELSRSTAEELVTRLFSADYRPNRESFMRATRFRQQMDFAAMYSATQKFAELKSNAHASWDCPINDVWQILLRLLDLLEEAASNINEEECFQPTRTEILWAKRFWATDLQIHLELLRLADLHFAFEGYARAFAVVNVLDQHGSIPAQSRLTSSAEMHRRFLRSLADGDLREAVRMHRRHCDLICQSTPIYQELLVREVLSCALQSQAMSSEVPVHATDPFLLLQGGVFVFVGTEDSRPFEFSPSYQNQFFPAILTAIQTGSTLYYVFEASSRGERHDKKLNLSFGATPSSGVEQIQAAFKDFRDRLVDSSASLVTKRTRILERIKLVILDFLPSDVLCKQSAIGIFLGSGNGCRIVTSRFRRARNRGQSSVQIQESVAYPMVTMESLDTEVRRCVSDLKKAVERSMPSSAEAASAHSLLLALEKELLNVANWGTPNKASGLIDLDR